MVLAGSDGSWGPTVAIKDSAGRVWRLCGVASPAVKEGETVSAGQTLGKVGSVSCECAEESHSHLEVKQAVTPSGRRDCLPLFCAFPKECRLQLRTDSGMIN